MKMKNNKMGNYPTLSSYKLESKCYRAHSFEAVKLHNRAINFVWEKQEGELEEDDDREASGKLSRSLCNIIVISVT